MPRFFAILAATLTLALGLTGCGYNDFQRLDEQTKAAWSEVLNQYQRRADLVPNIVATVKGVQGNFTTNPGYIASWSVVSPGTLSNTYASVNLPQPAGLPFSLSTVPGRQAFVGSDLASGAIVYDYSNGMSNMNIKTLSVPGNVAICWSVSSPKTNSYFLSDLVADVITEIGLQDDLTPYIIGVSAPPP